MLAVDLGAVGRARRRGRQSGVVAPVVHARFCSRSDRRCANSGVTSPPGSRVKCTDLNRSGTLARDASVSSMQIGRMNTASSAMLRVRSIA